jgi:hypothetical protein
MRSKVIIVIDQHYIQNDNVATLTFYICKAIVITKLDFFCSRCEIRKNYIIKIRHWWFYFPEKKIKLKAEHKTIMNIGMYIIAY